MPGRKAATRHCDRGQNGSLQDEFIRSFQAAVCHGLQRSGTWQHRDGALGWSIVKCCGFTSLYRWLLYVFGTFGWHKTQSQVPSIQLLIPLPPTINFIGPRGCVGSRQQTENLQLSRGASQVCARSSNWNCSRKPARFRCHGRNEVDSSHILVENRGWSSKGSAAGGKAERE